MIKIICLNKTNGLFKDQEVIEKGEILNVNINMYDKNLKYSIYKIENDKIFNMIINNEYIGEYNYSDFCTLEEFRENRLNKILNEED